MLLKSIKQIIEPQNKVIIYDSNIEIFEVEKFAPAIGLNI